MNIFCKTEEQFLSALNNAEPLVLFFASSGRPMGHITVDFHFACKWEGELYQAIYCFDEREVKKHGMDLCVRFCEEIVAPSVARVAKEANGLKIEESSLNIISFKEFINML